MWQKPSAFTTKHKERAVSDNISRLLSIMSRLRDPQTGCPWDLKQSYVTIVPYTLEEAYEVADAIARESFDELKDELGDLLFQVVFYAQMAKEEGITLIDLYPHFLGTDNKLNKAYTIDGLHLTAAGYKVWAEILKKGKYLEK